MPLDAQRLWSSDAKWRRGRYCEQTGTHRRRRKGTRFGRHAGSDRSLHLCADRRLVVSRASSTLSDSCFSAVSPASRAARSAIWCSRAIRCSGSQPALPRARRGDPDVPCRAPPRVPLQAIVWSMRWRSQSQPPPGVDRARGRSVLADRPDHGCRDRHLRRPDARCGHQRDPAGAAAGRALRQRLPLAMWRPTRFCAMSSRISRSIWTRKSGSRMWLRWPGCGKLFLALLQWNHANTFTRHVSELRTGKACELLANSTMAVTEICHEAGCHNIRQPNAA